MGDLRTDLLSAADRMQQDDIFADMRLKLAKAKAVHEALEQLVWALCGKDPHEALSIARKHRDDARIAARTLAEALNGSVAGGVCGECRCEVDVLAHGFCAWCRGEDDESDCVSF